MSRSLTLGLALAVALEVSCASTDGAKPAQYSQNAVMNDYLTCVNEGIRKEKGTTESSLNVETPIASVQSESETKEDLRALSAENQSKVLQTCENFAKRSQHEHESGSSALAIVSGVGIGVGAVTTAAAGILYLKSSSSANSNCLATTGACDSTGASAASAATTEAWVAYGGLGLAAAGLIVLLTSLPHEPAVHLFQPQFGASPNGAMLGGSF